ncbi:hypothetical protein HDU91_000364 [Kappamyces sp. JEL0680]|nr:hypothetical protein HDU91_000364 [Kappamyces sp. JEL0680]
MSDQDISPTAEPQISEGLQLAPGSASTPEVSLEFQLFPHSETPLHRQDGSNRPFLFSPVEKKITPGTVVQIGRKIDRNKEAHRGTTREDRAINNVSTDPSHMSLSDKDGTGNVNPIQNCIAFRSKVVSRHHAELWMGKDNQDAKRVGPAALTLEIYKAVMIKIFINSKKSPAAANKQKWVWRFDL